MTENKTMPRMESGKCMEHCSHKDDMGFCLAGDSCIKFGVNNVTGRPLREEPLFGDDSHDDEPKQITLMEVQNMLGQAMRDLMDKKKTAKERQEARETARELSAVAKQLMTGFDLTLEAYGLLAARGIDAKGVRGLIE